VNYLYADDLKRLMKLSAAFIAGSLLDTGITDVTKIISV